MVLRSLSLATAWGVWHPGSPFHPGRKAGEFDSYTRFAEPAGEIASDEPSGGERLSQVLNQYKKCLSGHKIVGLGVGYEKNLGDMHEYLAMVLIDLYKKQRGRNLLS